MQYKIFYQTVIKILKQSINTKDQNLKDKIFNCLLNWYKENFEVLAIKSCNVNDQITLASIMNQISIMCKENDLVKLKTTYEDPNYNEFCKISLEIFELVKNSNGKKIDNFAQQYNEYYNKLKSYESLISPIFINEYKYNLSESILDLNLLKEGDNTKAYSIRASSYFNNN